VAPTPSYDEATRDVAVTRIFTRTRNANTQIIVNRGGARSSKSYSIAQLLLTRFFGMPRRQILVLRKTLPALRISTKMLVDTLLDQYNLRERITEERVSMNYWYKGSLIHFGSVDDPEKIKSTEWNDIWMEEATEFTYDDFMNLKLRLSSPNYGHNKRNQMFLSFNPIDENHWIKTKLIDPKREDLIEIQSTYRDNQFLPAEYVKLIEDLMEQDPNYYRIFGLGEWGKLDHLIYQNWDEIPELFDGDTFYGVDFGFNKPTAVVKCVVDGMDAGVEQVLYSTKKTNQDLISFLDEVIPTVGRERHTIYADNAEPNRIEEINKAGKGFKCLPANKSVLDGIDTVRRFRLHITQTSPDLLKEIKGYAYRVDKNEVVHDEPVKLHDHLMDAMRYAIHTRYFDKVRRMAVGFRMRYLH
jgi:phage terminase large subunit